MVCFNVGRKEITAKVAAQMRVGICAGEIAYSLFRKGDVRATRRVIYDLSKSPKYTYLSAMHTLRNNMRLH